VILKIAGALNEEVNNHAEEMRDGVARREVFSEG
jgi:hypothetical protein